ncbi:hypothetical protein B0I72DRAFT_151215 [Yarrowia lipolytica]|jgi:pyruvate/2-oxoglutarate dehydrogenase complex dihydrolipoamide acyltransferase (E2) component|uniref:YALI0D27214p n=2 Tax=Yarrowia lipolytica TaxID=4952 RepID=Q6C7L0_YARLI|nr:YALI0D27214p [Yarrowia lipolytica CLIB122]QNP98132.1 Hypothetical protein YALI2_D00573g [Yarrowia lipolytica]RDW26692.1 hypothetical protein B0I71DRAFT_158357 [Yarrowia lipolytica]RDW34319.1 hypothetical protein B0I72DRAFT_151215 [Yarrowia lipolytica]RDW39884.1 hypothetical protein B0I73DRAFT_117918 [Yarrowia lipolytica]RDW46696.1 hypothetical protein B0I74DRAFT_167467 [Yarrowia lipolytica]|eukprot:XP_503352.1 YALI0D27214p [Yarrowia lipolytica CLIB122]
MQFSAVLLAAAAGLVSAQKFSLVAIRSGSDIQNDAITSDGKSLVLNGNTPTTYEVIGRSLYANGKPVQFGDNATIVATDGQASKDIIVNGDNHLYVPNFDFTACPNGKNGYDIVNNQFCKSGGLGFAARAVFEGGSSSAAAPTSSSAASHAASSAAASASHAASSAAASKASSAAASKASSAVAAPKSEAAAGAHATAGAIVSQINDGQIQAPHSTGPAQAPKASAPPAQANGAATLGVSAVAGAVAVAMLF